MFHGTYKYNSGVGLYFVTIENNYKEAEKILGTSIEGKDFPLCCNPSFTAKEGEICFDFRAAGIDEIPILGGPGPSPKNKAIKLLEFKE